MFKKIARDASNTPSPAVDVTAEPLEGHSDEEVIRALESHGASEILHLAPGFISARVVLRDLGQAREIASIAPKVKKTIH